MEIANSPMLGIFEMYQMSKLLLNRLLQGIYLENKCLVFKLYDKNYVAWPVYYCNGKTCIF